MNKQKKVTIDFNRYLTKAFVVFLMLLAPLSVFSQQQKTLRGTVSDEQGETLPGVSITVKGMTKGVATVSAAGGVTAIAKGEAVISAITPRDGFKDEIAVTVISSDIPVTGVALNKTEIELLEGETEQMTVSFTPADATNHGVTWSSDDDKIATVDAKGLIKAVAPGTTVITVTTDDGGHMASVAVTVKEAEGAAGTYTGNILMDNNPLASNVPIVLKSISETKVSIEASANLIIGGNIDLEGELDATPDGNGGFELNGNAMTTAPALAPIPLPTVIEGTINSEGELYLHLIITGVSQKMEFKGKK